MSLYGDINGHNIFDVEHDGWEDGTEDDYVRESPSKTCRQCGTGGLSWAGDGGRWYLQTRSGERHVCPDPMDGVLAHARS